MITLTTPPQINSVLGGTAPVGYDKLVVGPFTMDPVNQTVLGQLRLTSTANPSMQAITGSLSISVPRAELIVDVPQLDFYRRIVTSAAQNTSILNMIETSQAQIENGLVSPGIAVVQGVRSAGV